MILFILLCCRVGLHVLNGVDQHFTFSLMKLSSLISLSFIFNFCTSFLFLQLPLQSPRTW